MQAFQKFLPLFNTELTSICFFVVFFRPGRFALLKKIGYYNFISLNVKHLDSSQTSSTFECTRQVKHESGVLKSIGMTLNTGRQVLFQEPDFEDFIDETWDYVSRYVVTDSYWTENKDFLMEITFGCFDYYRKSLQEQPNGTFVEHITPKDCGKLIEGFLHCMHRFNQAPGIKKFVVPDPTPQDNT